MIEERLEKWYEKTGKKVAIILSVIVIGFIIIKLNIIGLFAPFILAWLFASMLNVFVSWSNKKVGIPRALGTIISMLTILSGVLGLLTLIIKKLWEQIIAIAYSFPDLTQRLLDEVNGLENKLSGLIGTGTVLGPISNLDELIQEIMDTLSNYLGTIIPVAYNAVSKVPDIILFTVVMLVATFFMTKDYYKIKDFVKAQFSDTIVDKVVIMQKGVLSAIGGYVRTQLIMMSITFCICITGLFVFRVNYALLISVIIAFVDALPVFGSGAILIPWALYNLIIGQYTLGVGLLCIYGIIFMVRQIFEPKILSTQIGVYALVTVMAVYIGYRTMGFLGLIIGPALAVILKMLQNVGALPQFKPVKKADSRGEKVNEKYSSKRDNRSS